MAGVRKAYRIYLYLCNHLITFMKRLAILLFTFAIIIACNNNNDKRNSRNTMDEKAIRDDGDSDKDDRSGNKDNDKNGNAPYRWTEKERNKFVKDCKRESAENVARDKINDFCSCMLSQAQKYYPSYKEMDENSNEESDRKILDECLEKYTDKDSDD
jgi:hypothetical protein